MVDEFLFHLLDFDDANLPFTVKLLNVAGDVLMSLQVNF